MNWLSYFNASLDNEMVTANFYYASLPLSCYQDFYKAEEGGLQDLTRKVGLSPSGIAEPSTFSGTSSMQPIKTIIRIISR